MGIDLIIIFSLGLLVVIYSYNKVLIVKNKISIYLFISLIVFHFLLFIYNYQLLNINNLDTDYRRFFKVASSANNWLDLFGTGNKSIPFLIYPLVKLKFSFLNLNILFSLISLYGYFIYLSILSTYISQKSISLKIIGIIFCIAPSIHFWTVSMGKEAIIFTLMAILFKKISTDKVNSYSVWFSILLILLIRPYLAGILMFSITILNFKKFNIFYKYSIISGGLIGSFVIFKFLRIRDLSSFKTNYLMLAKFSSEAGSSSIDLLSTNYFERVFLVLFRPLFYDSQSILQDFVSIENSVWLLMFLAMIFMYKKFKIGFKHMRFNFLLIHIVFTVCFYSVYMYNLGLASRMRVMFLPYLIFLFLLLANFEKKSEKSN